MGTTESTLIGDTEEAQHSPTDVEGNVSPTTSHHREQPKRTAATSRKSSRPTPPPLIQLDGAVVGMEGSGKRTLLQRLDGKDPFDAATRQDIAPIPHVMVPYQPPRTTWDRIRLRVRASERISTDESLDFVVVLLNPQSKKLKKYVKSIIQSVLTIQGYSNTSPEEAKTKTCKPLCLCFLLNFRDVINPENENSVAMQESEITSLTMDLLLQNSNVDSQKLCLQFGITSLKNCYGLDILHHFIYQSYLQRKKHDLEQMLAQVRDAQIQTRAPPRESYSHFVRRVSYPDSAVVDSAQRTGKSQKQQSTSQSRETQTGKHRAQPGGRERRQMFSQQLDSSNSNSGKASNTATTSSQAIPKVALEEFLASSDDEDEKATVVASSKRKGAKSAMLAGNDDDDSYDDDFFVTGKESGSTDDSDSEEINAVSSEKVVLGERISTVQSSTTAQTSIQSVREEATTCDAASLVNDDVHGVESESKEAINPEKDASQTELGQSPKDPAREGNAKQANSNSINASPPRDAAVQEENKVDAEKLQTVSSQLSDAEVEQNGECEEETKQYSGEEPSEKGSPTVHRSKNDSSKEKEIQDLHHEEKTSEMPVDVALEPTSPPSKEESTLDWRADQPMREGKADTSVVVDEEDGDSDDDLFIGEESRERAMSETSLKESNTATPDAIPAKSIPIDDTNKVLVVPKEEKPGLSSAALAAIAAAQREAETMANPSLTKAAKKEKKRKKEEKKKKKSKTKEAPVDATV